MNWFGFFSVLRQIYGKGLPDLDYIQNQGLLAVKIGQTYALRIDFLREETCKHLGQLYRHTESISPAAVSKLLAQYTTKEWKENFEYIGEKPLASASVGQVHRARLKSGENVIVKIIKEDFRKRFIRDVLSLRKLLKLILFFYPKLQKVADPLGILDNIRNSTLSELDLRNEIDGQETLQEIYNTNKDRFMLSKMRFPKLYREISGENILVEEYVEGETFDELLDRKKLGYEMLLDLFRIHGFFVFCIGTFHGDIHPGNIILSKNRDALYFVDTGAVSTVGEKMRTGLFNFFEALSEYNYKQCAYCLNRMAEHEIDGKRYAEFEKKMTALYSDFTGSTVSQVSLTRRMMETIKLGVNSGMVFEEGMYPIIKSLMYLDGMVLRCNPDAVLVRDMRPFIDEFKKSMH